MKWFQAGPRQRRVAGMLLMISAALGLLISVAGVIIVNYAGIALRSGLGRQLDALEQALDATSEGLDLAEASLVEAERTVGNLSATVASASRAVSDTQPSLAALETLSGTRLPATIASTRQALYSAAETARAVDAVLRALSIFGVPYNPDVPLNVAIEGVAETLDDMPPALDEIASGINTARKNTTTIAGDLNEVATGLEALSANLGGARGVVGQYQEVVGELQRAVAGIRTSAPFWIGLFQGSVTLLLIWLVLVQPGLLLQGWDLYQQGHE
ncbi:MAG: hypothetical protein RMK84_13895 [Oscillochloridaceae bacterium]|nr:hypothetical protein [Chloroflexaceae bacterium]MDW8391212.1 hypothetical protein [Oscillochloridaceae bacterium]